MNILDIEKGVNEFNLEDFYLQDLNGGFIIISPKQTIAMYNDDVAKETRVHSGPHGEKIEKLFQIMYLKHPQIFQMIYLQNFKLFGQILFML